jgi:hypothetical protein
MSETTNPNGKTKFAPALRWALAEARLRRWNASLPSATEKLKSCTPESVRSHQLRV